MAEPARIWSLDEKGFNDEGVSSSIGLASVGNTSVSTGHSRAVPHISVLTAVSVVGGVAKPTVVVLVAKWHDDL